jgi:phosphoribosylformylglycinamidine synthase
VSFNIPVTGGNVSFYNQTGDVAIHPTPVVGVLGVIDEVDRRLSLRWKTDGDLIYVVGETHDEFDGSEWANHIYNHLGGLPPRLDIQKEIQLSQILVAGSRDGLLEAAHDVSDGGIMQALVEMFIHSNHSARVWIPQDIDPFVFSYSESASRAVVVVARSEEHRFVEMCGARGIHTDRIGVVDSDISPDSILEVSNAYGETLTFTYAELFDAHTSTFTRIFGETVG